MLASQRFIKKKHAFELVPGDMIVLLPAGDPAAGEKVVYGIVIAVKRPVKDEDFVVELTVMRERLGVIKLNWFCDKIVRCFNNVV